jgi:hypothetical protein
LRHSGEDLKATQQQHQVEGRCEFQTWQAKICWIAVQPVVRRAAANGPNGGGAVPNGGQGVSTLSPNPQTLYLLWGEYEHGIGARLFSWEERGKVKHKHHRRKIVWDCIATLVPYVTAQIAIDRVYQVYGANTTVTRIINKMKQDRQASTVPPLLQV